MKLAVEDLRGLARLNYEMDMGIRPFIIWCGNRLAITPEQLEKFNLHSGQTIPDPLFEAITRDNIARVENELLQQCSPSDFEEK